LNAVAGAGDDGVHQFCVDTNLEAKEDKQQYGVVRVDSVGRRWYTQRFKTEVVAQCLAPGASVSRISIEHGLNTNLVRKWVQRARRDQPPALVMPVLLEERELVTEATSSSNAIEIHIGEAVIAIGTKASVHQIEAVVRALR